MKKRKKKFTSWHRKYARANIGSSMYVSIVVVGYLTGLSQSRSWIYIASAQSNIVVNCICCMYIYAPKKLACNLNSRRPPTPSHFHANITERADPSLYIRLLQLIPLKNRY